MTSILKPSRVLWLAVVALATLCITLSLALDASAQGRGDDSMLPPNQSEGCGKKYKPNYPSTYACVRFVDPGEVTEGVPFKITLKFRARKTLKNVKICITNPNDGTCAYKRKFKRLKKGLLVRSAVVTIKSTAASRSTRATTSYRGRIIGKGETRDDIWLATWSGLVRTAE